MIEKQSLTNMNHVIIEELSPAPFDELALRLHSGEYQFLSYDMFRRLYNDAVESMQAYRKLAEDYQQKYGSPMKTVDSITFSVVSTIYLEALLKNMWMHKSFSAFCCFFYNPHIF